MDSFLAVFVYGVLGGTALGLILSLISANIYKTLKLIEKGG